MTDNKKNWVKPELMVLVRCEAEEAVLTACKYIVPSVGPMSWDNHCIRNYGDPCADYVVS
jgi:hypothetical protein